MPIQLISLNAKKCAEKFDELIPKTAMTHRFVGNTSFRCTAGFPSFRDQGGNNFYISKRNVDKKDIKPSSFVPVQISGNENSNICYGGYNKPSVDSPIQRALYHYFPKINYMIHGHVYITNAPKTKWPVPCGSLQEINEILEVVDGMKVGYALLDSFVINLNGHGFIAGAEKVPELKGILNNMEARPAPELQN